jgi:hypothetical protein
MKVLPTTLMLLFLGGSIGCGVDTRLNALSKTSEIRVYTFVSDAAPPTERRITDAQSISMIVRIIQAAPLDEKAMRPLGVAYTKPSVSHDPFVFFSNGRYVGRASYFGDGLMWDGPSGFMFKILNEDDRRTLRKITTPDGYRVNGKQ